MSAKLLIERASWALVDQCAVSAGSFLLNVLLARSLSPHEYGEFTLFLGAIYLMRTIDYSLISYPLSLELHAVSDSERAGLFGNTVLLTVALSLVLAAVVALGITVLDATDILLPACLCYLCWQAQETSRRCLLAEFRCREAVAGDMVGFLGQPLLVALLLWTGSFTLSSALYVMSATFTAGAFVHASRFRFAWPDLAATRRLAREYLSVGKWSLVECQLGVVRVQLFPWLLAATAGAAATASFQAGANIANMITPIMFGIGNSIPQIAAQAKRAGRGTLGAARAASGYVFFGLGAILIICSAAILMPEVLLRTVYGPSSPYLAATTNLQILAVAGVFGYIADMGSKTLLGVQAGRLASMVNVVVLAAGAVLAFVLIGRWGVFGACLGLSIANGVHAIGTVLAIAWLIADEKWREQVRPRLAGRASSRTTVVSARAEQ
jgi:O-antigen/teichoic acid export membrane protein